MEEDKERISPKRLTVEISEELHQKIKVMASKRNITIRKYVLRALERALQAGAPLTPEIRGR